MFKKYISILIAIIACLPVTDLNAQDLYDLNHISDIRITFTESDWDQRLDAMKQANSNSRLVARVSIDGITYDSVGVRYKGNSSYFNVRNAGLPKLPFNLKANEIRKGQRFGGKYEMLKLTNVFRDPTFVREVLSYEIARQYMVAPRASYVRVYVNEQYLGLYCNTESIDDTFLQTHFTKSNGTLFKCDPNWNDTDKKGCPTGDKASLMYQGEDSLCYQPFYELNSKTGWKELIQLTRILNKEPEKLDSVLNIDQAIWMLAFDNVLVNLDSYLGRLSHNYYLYKDSTGRFVPLVWDLNLSFGAFNLDGSNPAPLPLDKLQTISPFLHFENTRRPLVSQMLKNPLYRKLYIARVRTILKDWFSNNKYEKRMYEIVQLIDNQVRNDTKKLYSYEAFRQNLTTSTELGKLSIVGITELMSKRIIFLNNHPLLSKTPPSLSDATNKLDGEKVSIKVQVKNGNIAHLVCRKDGFSHFRRQLMFDDGQHGDAAAGDGIFGITIDKSVCSDYYFIAENDDTAATLPEAASKEFFKVL